MIRSILLDFGLALTELSIIFVSCILDNSTTAMTGNQPTPATGHGVTGDPTVSINIEQLVRGCGIDYCKTVNPMEFDHLLSEIKEAVAYSRKNGPAVVISKSPCLLSLSKGDIKARYKKVTVNDQCDGCGYCVSHFECPALVMGDGVKEGDKEVKKVHIDTTLCTGLRHFALMSARKIPLKSLLDAVDEFSRNEP